LEECYFKGDFPLSLSSCLSLGALDPSTISTSSHPPTNPPTLPTRKPNRHDHGSFFPGTGAATDVGTGPGEGLSFNIPWDGPGAGDADYIAAFTRALLPVAYEFAPDLLIVSAGFDAAEGDPLGGCHVSPGCFGHLTALLQPVAPLVLLLEVRGRGWGFVWGEVEVGRCVQGVEGFSCGERERGWD